MLSNSKNKNETEFVEVNVGNTDHNYYLINNWLWWAVDMVVTSLFMLCDKKIEKLNVLWPSTIVQVLKMFIAGLD